MGQRPRKVTNMELLLSSPHRVKTKLLSWYWCVTTRTAYCQPGKLTQTLVSKAFYRTPSCRHKWLPTWWISVSSPSEDGADTLWSKASALSHIVDVVQSLHATLLLSGWHKTPRQTKTFLSSMAFQELRGSSQKPGAKVRSVVGLNSLTTHLIKYEWLYIIFKFWVVLS